MSQDLIEEVEVTIAEAKKMVALGNSLERLLANRDFKKVIREEFMEREAVRLVHLKADPNMQSEESQQAITKQMDAIGYLAMFIYRIEHATQQAQNMINDGEETLDELRQDELRQEAFDA